MCWSLSAPTISIRTPYATPSYDTQRDTLKLYTLDLNKAEYSFLHPPSMFRESWETTYFISGGAKFSMD